MTDEKPQGIMVETMTIEDIIQRVLMRTSDKIVELQERLLDMEVALTLLLDENPELEEKVMKKSKDVDAEEFNACIDRISARFESLKKQIGGQL